MDYLQKALAYFNIGKSQWYGWRTHDDNEIKIPNNERMCYDCLILNDDTATMPTKAEVEAKIQELKDAEVAREVKKEEAKAKLLELGLTEEHLKALGI
jgi:hypothetical protein